MTTLAKRYIKLNDQIENCENKASKFESGYNYDSQRAEVWSNKVAVARAKQDKLILSPEDIEAIEEFYGCSEMF